MFHIAAGSTSSHLPGFALKVVRALSFRVQRRSGDIDPHRCSLRVSVPLMALLGVLATTQTSLSFADNANGKALYLQRCAVCHGPDIKGTGPLAHKSTPPTPDLTTSAFKKRLKDYPGVIVSSVILRPNGNLIPKTLQENGVKIPPHAWSVKDFRDLNEYMGGVINGL